MIKALLLDIDNTLLRLDGHLSQASIDAVTAAKNKGITVILATARGYRSTEPVHAKLQLTTPVVCHVGAMVYDYSRQAPLQTWPLDTNTAHELAQLADNLNLRISAYVGREVWFNRAPKEPLRPGWIVKEQLATALRGVSTLGMVVTGEEAVDRMILEIKRRPLVNFVSLGRLHEFERTWLYINKAGASKATALDWLLPRLDLSWQGAAACGDGLSDLEMITKAAWGLAAPLAHPLVKLAANAPFILDETEPVASLVQEILKQR